MTTVSMESGESQGDPEARLADFSEEEERCVYRLGEANANSKCYDGTVTNTNYKCWSEVEVRRLWTRWWRSALPRSRRTGTLRTGEEIQLPVLL